MGILWRLFGKKNPLENLTRTELESERLGLEREERKKLAKLKHLEEARKREFEKGIGREFERKRAIMREFHRLGNQIVITNRDLNRLNQQLIAIDNLTNALDMKESLVSRGIWAKLRGVSANDLENALSDMHMTEDELAATLQRITETFSIPGPFHEDELLNGEDEKLIEAWKMAEKGMDLDQALAEYERETGKEQRETEVY